VRNVADREGVRVLKKGIILTEEHLAQLTEMGHAMVDVAVLEADDIHEDAAALALAGALQTRELSLSRPGGGRVNLRTVVDGLLEVDAGRLLELNLLPGITLATRRRHTVVGPHQETGDVGTLKIIPFAVKRRDLDRALALAGARPGIVEVRPFWPGRRAAVLFVGEAAVHRKLHEEYLLPTRTRLERLGVELVSVEDVMQEEAAIARAAADLATQADLLMIAGQTSVMDDEDLTLRALRRAGAEGVLSGAPVEPGNLLALAYLPNTAVMCIPGCARSLRRNVVDLVLPRLLLGDRLGRRDVAELGLGGFLMPAERGGDGL
jgi:hypothetical protein